MTPEQIIAQIKQLSDPQELRRIFVSDEMALKWLTQFNAMNPATRSFAIQSLRAVSPEIAQLVESFVASSVPAQKEEPRRVKVEVLEVKTRQ